MIDALDHVAPWVLGLVAIANGWLIWRINEGRREREALRSDMEDIDHKLTGFILEVAKMYVSNTTLMDVEKRLVAAVDRLGDRFDRAFEARREG